jgi:hypothetical protein
MKKLFKLCSFNGQNTFRQFLKNYDGLQIVTYIQVIVNNMAS